MVGSQKILTVSYGTFSCTLEGFEDSFGTMKAIAEYFRDLAADDRYFGAEPPVPDAETLQRIAQREVARRVEARMEGSGLVLRVDNTVTGSLGGDVVAPAPEGAPEPPAVAAPPAPVMPPRPAAPVVERTPERVSERVPVASRRDQDDGVAAKLARIRAVVGRAALASAEEEPARDVVLAAELPVEAPADVAPPAKAARPARKDLDEAASWREAAPVAEAEPDAPEPKPFGVEPTGVDAEAEEADGTPAPAVEALEPAPEVAPVVAPLAGTEAQERAAAAKAVPAPGADLGATDPRDGAGAERPGPLMRPRVIRLRRAAPDLAALPQTGLLQTGPARAEPAASAPVPAPTGAAFLLSPEEEAALMAELASLGAQGAPPARPEEDGAEAAVAGFMATLHGAGQAPDLAPAVEEVAVAPPAAPEGTGREPGAVPDAAIEGPLATVAEAAPEAQGPAAPEAAQGAVARIAGDAPEVAPEPTLEPAPGAAPEASFAAWESDDSVAPLSAPAAEAAEPTGAPEAGPQAEAAPAPRGETEAPDAWITADATPAAPVGDGAVVGPLLLIGQAAGEAKGNAPDAASSATGTGSPALEPSILAAEAGGRAEAPDAPPATPVNGTATLGPLLLTAEAARPRQLAGGPDGDEAAVARLLSRADAQLAEPEASRRREALAQLRAAVAATEAARRLGEAAPAPARREDPFRDDLRQAVRPRRPVAQDGRGEPRSDGRPDRRPDGRPDRPRPAPLKLVASQRVDLGPEAQGLAPSPVRPIRPRRVSAGTAPAEAAAPTAEVPAAGAEAGARGSFAAFAAEMGAASLTDILEAAAAFTSFVEGAEDFSRPQVIDRAREAGAAEFSREDGLRSFGTLLRQGTITRVRGGRFQVAGESRFNPARRAG